MPRVPTILSVEGVRKTYGDAVVLDDVHLDVAAGEVHALLGENGAGKSTLIKIIAGVVTPDSGRVTVDGTGLRFGSPHAAMAIGVSTLFQELATVPGLTVAENVFLGRPAPSRWGVIRWGALNRAAAAIFVSLGQSIDVTRDVDRLSPVERTMTALARVLAQESRLLILDEPTAALTDSETTEVFAVIRRLRARGVAIVYVSHRLDEVLQIADRYTILRNGRLVAQGDIGDTTVEAVIADMAGRPVDSVFPSWTSESGSVVLDVAGLNGRRVRDVSFSMRAGEVVGIAGLAGSGRSELLRILGGASSPRSGRHGARRSAVRAAQSSPGTPRGRGAGAPGATVTGAHAGLRGAQPQCDHHRRPGCGVGDRLPRRASGRMHRDSGRRSGCAARGLDQEVLTLSGGNQQKVVLGKFLALAATGAVAGRTNARRGRVHEEPDLPPHPRPGCGRRARSSWSAPSWPRSSASATGSWCSTKGGSAGAFDRGAATEEQLLHVCYGRAAERPAAIDGIHGAPCGASPARPAAHRPHRPPGHHRDLRAALSDHVPEPREPARQRPGHGLVPGHRGGRPDDRDGGRRLRPVRRRPRGARDIVHGGRC